MVKKTVVQDVEACEYQLEQERLRELREERKERSVTRRNRKKTNRHVWANQDTSEG